MAGITLTDAHEGLVSCVMSWASSRGNLTLLPQGGTLIFSSYVGSRQASTVYPQKYQEFQAPPKKYLKFQQPQKISPILYPKMHRIVLFCNDPPKISTKSSYPQKYSFFMKTPQNIEIQNFEPQKMAQAYLCMKTSEYPHACKQWTQTT